VRGVVAVMMAEQLSTTSANRGGLLKRLAEQNEGEGRVQKGGLELKRVRLVDFSSGSVSPRVKENRLRSGNDLRPRE
jgi:hypothetical protein